MKNVFVNETGIAWPSDIERFRNVKRVNGTDVDYKDHQWIDMTDGKFFKIFFDSNLFARTFYCLDETFRVTDF